MTHTTGLDADAAAAWPLAIRVEGDPQVSRRRPTPVGACCSHARGVCVAGGLTPSPRRPRTAVNSSSIIVSNPVACPHLALMAAIPRFGEVLSHELGQTYPACQEPASVSPHARTRHRGSVLPRGAGSTGRVGHDRYAGNNCAHDPGATNGWRGAACPSEDVAWASLPASSESSYSATMRSRMTPPRCG